MKLVEAMQLVDALRLSTLHFGKHSGKQLGRVDKERSDASTINC